MKIQYISIQGKRVPYYGSLSSQKVLLVIERSNPYKYSVPIYDLLNKLDLSNHVVIWAHWEKEESVFDWVEHLKLCRQLARALGIGKSITLICHSVGGRIAAFLQEEANVERVLCFGYPFKHPDSPEEPQRTEVLKNIQIPFLIFQGKNDEYGGEEVLRRYLYSRFIHIQLLNTNHDYENLTDSDWNSIQKNLYPFLKFRVTHP
jgi:pimeloyl-ACP methyl ester carboxylesterase